LKKNLYLDGTYYGGNSSRYLDGISAISVFQFGQFEEVHDGRKYNIVELTKNPAFPLGSPGRARPHFATLVENILAPLLLALQVHGVICDREGGNVTLNKSTNLYIYNPIIS
jgi:hypothetical protein